MEKTSDAAITGQANKMEEIGIRIIRCGLTVVLIWIGILKFTSYEAAGVKPLGEHSPFLSWLLPILGTSGFAELLGMIEIMLGLLICCRPFAHKLSARGSMGAIITFCLTLTFLFSTPGVIQDQYSFPFISPMPGQFILKDLVLLGAAFYTAGEALAAAGVQKVKQPVLS